MIEITKIRGALEKKSISDSMKIIDGAESSGFLQGVDSRTEMIMKLIEALCKTEGYMFRCCQPSNGDIFAKWDDECFSAVKDLCKELGVK